MSDLIWFTYPPYKTCGDMAVGTFGLISSAGLSIPVVKTMLLALSFIRSLTSAFALSNRGSFLSL